MRYLLDTHCFLWHFVSPERLNAEARSALVEPTAELWLSVASIWEMTIKEGIGKLRLPESVGDFVDSRIELLGCGVLDIERVHIRALAALPLHHRDPFDRLLVAQAQVSQAVLITADAALGSYDVPTLFAG